VNPGCVDVGKLKFCGSGEVRQGCSELVLIEASPRVRDWVVVVEVAQHASRA